MNSNSILIFCCAFVFIIIAILFIALVILLFPSSKKTLKEEKIVYPPPIGTSNINVQINQSNAQLYNKPRLKYIIKKLFLTQNERVVFNMLKRSLANSTYYICPMVRLIDIVRIDAKPYTSEYVTLRNQIERKQIDFVIIELTTNKIICGIEVDDITHNSPKRIESDKFKDEVFETIGLKLFRINTYQFRENPYVFVNGIKEYVLGNQSLL